LNIIDKFYLKQNNEKVENRAKMLPIKTRQVISERSKTAPNSSNNFNKTVSTDDKTKRDIFGLNRRKYQSASNNHKNVNYRWCSMFEMCFLMLFFFLDVN
jgi:hypothetical protein